MRRSSVAIIALLLPLAGFAQWEQEKERALGRGLAEDIRRQGKPVDDAAVNEYLQRIAARLTAALGETPVSFTFEVLQLADAMEPMPLPGGYILVPAAFFAAVRDEAEFSGVLAHAIGHVVLRHGRTEARFAKAPLVFTGGWGGTHAEIAGKRRTLLPLGFLARQREYEIEADRFASDLAARAGFDRLGLKRYIERMQKDGERNSPLPPRDERLARLAQ